MLLLTRTPLNAGWEFVARSWPTPPGRIGYSNLEWLPATVPGCVHHDLIEHGVIADPFVGLHELGVQWVDEEDWIYRLRFRFEPHTHHTHRVLRFEGLDTVCRVYLDGELLGEHDDMFVPLEIDVSERLELGEHELRVEFESAARVGRERRAEFFAREGLPTHTVRFDERAFVRKAQYMFGWDWGPRLVSAGLWQAVCLLEHSGRLVDVRAQQSHRDDGMVELRITSEHEGVGCAWHYVEGVERPLRDGEPLSLRRPELWWPAGLGPQRLYTVTTLLLPADVEPPPTSALEAVDASTLDRRVTRIGLRRIELRREPDEFGESFEFVVNGRPVWAAGANWIPDHSYPALVSRERLRERLLCARDMNMNTLRVWGGGLYESDDFYDLCDELGFLVWQDFPYACSYYPDGPDAQAIAEREASVHVKRLRNRASLALWCGNNENLTMFQNGWEGRENNPPRYYGESIYEGVLPELLARLDPDRPYVPTSPWGGADANGDGIGDQHYWDVWHGRGDWIHYRDSKTRFSSEFGFASSPGPNSWKRIAPNALELEPRHAIARWHDKTLKGYDTFLGYAELHYAAATTIEEWIYTSQLNQRDALRFGIEHYRRSGFCRGSLIWQLNDCWPVQSWAVLDFDGDYKAAAFELRRLYAAALVTLELTGDCAEVWAVLDNTETSRTGEVVLEASSTLDGSTLGRWQQSLSLAPGERTRALRVDTSALPRRSTLLRASFAGSETFRLLSEPKDADTPRPRLRLKRLPGALEVTADVPVVDLYVWDTSDRPRGRLLDNFVTLPKPGTTTLRVFGELSSLRSLRARCLAGACELV